MTQDQQKGEFSLAGFVVPPPQVGPWSLGQHRVLCQPWVVGHRDCGMRGVKRVQGCVWGTRGLAGDAREEEAGMMLGTLGKERGEEEHTGAGWGGGHGRAGGCGV